MKIHFLKEDALAALKSNIPDNIAHYQEPTNEWIYRYFDEDPFMEFQIPVKDFELKFNREKGLISEQDVEAAKTLYLAMKDLSVTQATDERLWAGLCHNECWAYLQDRWKGSKNNGEASQTLKSRYFFGQDFHRSLFTNSLSRLWWLAYLVYDEKRAEPFELIKYFTQNGATKIVTLFSSNFTNNKEIARGLISSLMILEKEGYSGDEKRIWIPVNRYLNILGGTHILDFYSEEEIRDKILNYMHGLSNRK